MAVAIGAAGGLEVKAERWALAGAVKRRTEGGEGVEAEMKWTAEKDRGGGYRLLHLEWRQEGDAREFSRSRSSGSSLACLCDDVEDGR